MLWWKRSSQQLNEFHFIYVTWALLKETRDAMLKDWAVKLKYLIEKLGVSLWKLRTYIINHIKKEFVKWAIRHFILVQESP